MKTIVAVVSPVVTVTPVGGCVRVEATMDGEFSDAGPFPATLDAVTRNRYVVPVARF